jgi:hypothetical protein
LIVRNKDVKETEMRIVVATLLTVLAGSATGTAQAQGYDPYPWCAEYGFRGGATNCYFATYQQCQWALAGNGGYCRRNLFYTGPYGGEPRRYRKRGY